MAYIKGYFFENYEQAEKAVNIINEGENLPHNNGLTNTYCLPKKCIGGYYIIYDEVTSKYLTEVVNIEIEIPKQNGFR